MMSRDSGPAEKMAGAISELTTVGIFMADAVIA